MTTTQQDLLAHDVHPQELRVTLLAVRYRFAGADARRAIREEIDGMQSEHRCQFGVSNRRLKRGGLRWYTMSSLY
jgi:hypothetical protein